ncbi:MAG TPA: AI-2E family transporter [Dongiaceae bacterium]|nr:AI-2E family transporter [Dongiaceae bacterium]
MRAGNQADARGVVRATGEHRRIPTSAQVMANATPGRKPNEAAENRAQAAAPAQAEAQSAGEAAAEQIGRTINVQTVFLGIIAGILVLYTLYIAQTIVVPLVLAVVLNLVLTPLVLALARFRIPTPAGAALVVAIFLIVLGIGLVTLSEPAAGWLRRLPHVIGQLSDRLDFLQGPAKQLKNAEEAINNLGAGGAPSSATPVAVVQETTLRGLLFNETSRFAMGGLTTLVLLYFMLAMGDTFLRRVVAAMPDFRTKKQAVEIAHQLQSDMSHYLLTVSAINVGFGVVVGLTMMATGMPNPLLWGAMAGLLNYIPFLGHTVSAIVIAIVALLSFKEIGPTLIPPVSFIVLAALEGNVVTPMILARRLTLNPVAVVSALLIWGWMWGTVGLLLAVPLLVVAKIACDKIPPLNPVGEFLGG